MLLLLLWLLLLRVLLLQRRWLRLRRLVAGILGRSTNVLSRVPRVLGLATRILCLVARVGSLLAGILCLVTWVLALLAGILSRLADILGLLAWVLMMARILRLVSWILLVGRVLRMVAGIVGLMTRILGARGRLVGLMTRILCLLGRSGRRSRWARSGVALRGRRGCSRNRGLPRGSRQRGRIPWLDGLLHDGTHHLAQPSSQPADFYLRPERACLLLYLLLSAPLCTVSSSLCFLLFSPCLLLPLTRSRTLATSRVISRVTRPAAIDERTEVHEITTVH